MTVSRMALPFWAWCVVAVFCAALYTLSVPLASAEYGLDLVVAFVIATVQCGSLVLAVFRPVTGAGLQLLAVVAFALAARDSAGTPWPLPVTGLVSLGALVLLLGVRERWVVSVATWWVSVVVLVALIVTAPRRYAVPDEWGTNLTVYATYTATVLVAAIALGQRGRIRADLAAARRDVELEQAQRRYVEERARIARELHDVVAHSMSLVHMRALSAPHRLGGASQAAVEEEFRDIAGSARAALAEMRQVLGVLRSDGDHTGTAPQPQLADIPALAEATSRAGVPVDCDIDAATVGPIAQLTAYRVVQEALSNVVRHAPSASASVRVVSTPTGLDVSVRNTHPDRADPPRPDDGGDGLRGMRERVDLLGGRLAAGPTADGGYAVTATIPTENR